MVGKEAYYESWAEYIYAKRLIMCMTQYNFAEYIQHSQSIVSRWESGTVTPSRIVGEWVMGILDPHTTIYLKEPLK